MFTLSVMGSSIGYATPIDAKTEKVFKTDIEKVPSDIVSIDIEKSKVASADYVRCGNLILVTNHNLVEKRIKKPITLHRRSCKTNKLKFTKIPLQHYNLPLKVGWNK